MDGFQYKALDNAWEIFQVENRAVISYVNNMPTIEDPDLNIEENNRFMRSFAGNDATYSEPFTDIFYPIVNDVNEKVVESSKTSDNASANDVVGVVSVTFYWRDMLKQFFSHRVDGMHVVIENSCNQSFTYTWSESEPKYLGDGDLHEPAYEDWIRSYALPVGDMYSEVQKNSDGCQYMIHTYPSMDMLYGFSKTESK